MELEDAVQNLVVVGGRLGTNLVDLGYLGIEELDRYLAEHLGIDGPPAAWLAQPQPAALKSLPQLLAERHMILPLAVEEKTLHLAMADPHHPTAMDEVSFATGLQIRPYALSDAHLAFLRERYLDIPREGRFAYLIPDGAKGRSRKQAEAPSVEPAPSAEVEEVQEAARERVASGLRPLEEKEELTDVASFTRLHSDWETHPFEVTEVHAPPSSRGDPQPESAPAAEDRALEPEEVAAVEDQLARAPDSNVIIDCALRLARSYATTAALFVVRRDVIRGCGAIGPEVPRRTDGLFVPLVSDSILAVTVADGEPFRGALPRFGIDEQLFGAIGRCDVGDAAIFPVRIRDRVVNLLYVDNGPYPLAETSIAALGAVCDGIARAYARLILLSKRRHC
jgi:hypothetical protein